MVKTFIKKLDIRKFRALSNVEINFGDHVTVICGKNGTSKSSILGIVAQIFSFDKDYVKNEEINFRQITGSIFKSKYSEHFRISNKFDQPGSMIVNIELHDGYTDQNATAKLELMKRGKLPRPVVRNNRTREKRPGQILQLCNRLLHNCRGVIMCFCLTALRNKKHVCFMCRKR